MQWVLNNAQFNDSKLLELKEKNIKQFISTEIYIPVWKIIYSYKTARGNDKQGEKFLFHREDYWDSVESEFMQYIKDYNEKNEYKKLSNVKILDCEYIGDIVLPIE